MTWSTRQIVSLSLAALMLVGAPAAPLHAQSSAEQANANQGLIRPDPKRAQRAAERGDKAQAEGRIDEALLAYDEAARYAPRDVAIVGRGAELRSHLIRGHVENAEQLALAGKLAVAKEELNVAMRIDPTNRVVAERLAEMEQMQDDEPRRPADISGLPRFQPQKGKRNLHLRGDTRSAYQQVAETFGVRVSFDPDLVSRNVRLDLDNVDFKTAMAVLGPQTLTFWRPINASLMFVVADTIEKRRQFGLQAEQTFYLPSSAAPEEMTELLRVLRDITGARHLELDAHTRTITIRDSPENLALAGELIHQIERARGELMLEIELLEVDRDKERQLGITPPSSWQAIPIAPNDVRALAAATDLQNALTILGQLLAAKGLSSVQGFTLVGGGYTRFLLTLPGVAANFSDALSLVESGRQVLLRAQDGKPATFFVGDRFPITLSLLSGSLGASNGANTGISFTGIPSTTNFPETSFAVGNNPVALVAVDLNEDGLPDLAVANQNDNTISILLNQNSGNFAAASQASIALPKTETSPAAISAGLFRNNPTDANGNPVPATPDLVVANSGSNNVGIFLGNGDGTFNEAVGSPYTVGKNPSSVVVADFNGDGNLDFAAANEGDNTISVFKGDGKGNFVPFPGSPFALTNTATVSEQGPVALIAGNFRNATLNTNNPNLLTNAPEVDLAVVNQATNNVSILLGSADTNDNLVLTEAANSPITVGKTPVAIASGDFNADGITDLAIVNQADATVSVLLGNSNANGSFSEATGSPLPTAATPAGITVANFTGGTVPDLAVTNKGQGTLGIYVGLGSGTFSNRIEIATPTSPGAIVSSVLTSSGLPDVALAAQGTTTNQGLVTIIQDSTSFASSGGGNAGAAQTPYPASQYEDIGVKVKATPTLHSNHEVTLQLEFEIRALSGSSVNGIPVISNRTLSQTIRIKEDETSVIAGLLDNEETRSLVGLPGFANLPAAGYLFGKRNTSLKNTEFLILITPRRLRDPVRHARALFAGRGDLGGRGSIGANAPIGPPPAPPPPTQAPPQQPPQ
jgi:type II secretory pathway component GspD/PulD (secretin)